MVCSVLQAVSVLIAASAFPAHPVMGIAGRGRRILRFPDGHCCTVGFSATTGGEAGAVKGTADSERGFRAPADEAGPALPAPYDAHADCDPPSLPGHTQRPEPGKRIFAFIGAELYGPPAIRRRACRPTPDETATMPRRPAIPSCRRRAERAGTDEINGIRGTRRPEFALRANALRGMETPRPAWRARPHCTIRRDRPAAARYGG